MLSRRLFLGTVGVNMPCTGAFLEVSMHDDVLTDVAVGLATVLSMVPWAFGAALFLGSAASAWLRSLIPVTLLVIVLNEFLLKHLVHQSRPSGSCLSTRGMPSSHSALAAAWASAIALRSMMSTAPRFLCLLLAGVPWARYRLSDHSLAQVSVGCLVGMTLAYAEYRLAKRMSS